MRVCVSVCCVRRAAVPDDNLSVRARDARHHHEDDIHKHTHSGFTICVECNPYGCAARAHTKTHSRNTLRGIRNKKARPSRGSREPRVSVRARRRTECAWTLGLAFCHIFYAGFRFYAGATRHTTDNLECIGILVGCIFGVFNTTCARTDTDTHCADLRGLWLPVWATVCTRTYKHMHVHQDDLLSR